MAFEQKFSREKTIVDNKFCIAKKKTLAATLSALKQQQQLEYFSNFFLLAVFGFGLKFYGVYEQQM